MTSVIVHETVSAGELSVTTILRPEVTEGSRSTTPFLLKPSLSSPSTVNNPGALSNSSEEQVRVGPSPNTNVGTPHPHPDVLINQLIVASPK